MRKINYSLIVSDFDGTLAREDLTVSEATKKKIEDYRKQGGHFAISTGRLPAAILSKAKNLGLKGAVACCHGALIMDIESGETIYGNFIPNAEAVEICERLESFGLHVQVYSQWEYYSNKDNDKLAWYERLTDTKAILALEKPISEILKETGINVCKFIIIVEPEENESVFSLLEKENFKGCTITKSSSVLVEVVNSNASKGTALEFLARFYGAPLEKTVAVGDQWNDLPMIEKAGLGIAVQNADEKLKQAANVVCDYTNEEDAIATIIDQYGFME